MADEYKRTCHDEMEWAEIDQLHAAAIEISKNCFEYKKLCVGLLGVGSAIIIKFSGDPFSHILFMLALLVCIGFWVADATAYFYQRSVRKAMDTKMLSIADRNKVDNYNKSITSVSKFGALFNGSMTLYYALLAMILTVWSIYGIGG